MECEICDSFGVAHRPGDDCEKIYREEEERNKNCCICDRKMFYQPPNNNNNDMQPLRSEDFERKYPCLRTHYGDRCDADKVNGRCEKWRPKLAEWLEFLRIYHLLPNMKLTESAGVVEIDGVCGPYAAMFFHEFPALQHN